MVLMVCVEFMWSLEFLFWIFFILKFWYLLRNILIWCFLVMKGRINGKRKFKVCLFEVYMLWLKIWNELFLWRVENWNIFLSRVLEWIRLILWMLKNWEFLLWIFLEWMWVSGSMISEDCFFDFVVFRFR